MPKRSSSEAPSQDGEFAAPATPSPSSEDELKDEKPKVKKARKTPSPKKEGAKGTINKWTPGEDEIFVQILRDLCKAGMWSAVKADGRIAYRGQPGIIAHTKAFLNKAKKD